MLDWEIYQTSDGKDEANIQQRKQKSDRNQGCGSKEEEIETYKRPKNSK